MSRVVRARVGFFLGVVLLAVGLGLSVGVGWGLVAAGVPTMCAFVWLYDVAEPERPERASRVRPRGDDW